MAKSMGLMKIIVCVLLLGLLLQLPAFFFIYRFSQAICSAANVSALLTSSNSLRFAIPSFLADSVAFRRISDGVTGIKTTGASDIHCLPQERRSNVSDGGGEDSSFYDLLPHGHAHYPFVQFSAYRASERAFFIVGLSSSVYRSFDQPVHKCRWLPANRSLDHPHEGDDPNEHDDHEPLMKVADAEMMYVEFDEHGMIYETATVNCTFREDVGVDGDGGELSITISTGPVQGTTIPVLALTEKPGDAADLLKKLHDPSPSPGYAFCGPPIHSTIRGEWVLHWLVYHHHLWQGKAHFFFYNVGGLKDEDRKLLRAFVKAGLVTIIDIPRQSAYATWYHNQLLWINDCLHRSRPLATWTFFHDFDEFLQVVAPKTLPDLLEENKHLPWMSFGSLHASNGHCRDPPKDPSEWPLERMLWVGKKPECMKPTFDPWTCIGAHGRRKYVANPRKVFLGGIHQVGVPFEGGNDLNASIARVHHYQGVLTPRSNPCGTKVNLSHPIEHLNWVVPGFPNYNRDDSISILIGKAREFAADLLRMS